MFTIGGRKSADLGAFGVQPLYPYRKIVAITPHATDPLPGGPTMGLWASADMTVTFKGPDGVTVTSLPLLKGENRIVATAVSAVSAGTLYACY